MSASPILFFATPCYRSDPKVAEGWMRSTVIELGLPKSLFCTVVSPFLALNQAQLVQAFRASECTHLLFRDDDIFVQPKVIQRMLDADVPAIVAPYLVRKEGRLDTVFGEDFEVKSAGTGCALIKRQVVETMWDSYYQEENFLSAEGVTLVNLFREFYIQRDNGRQMLQNDHSFWMRMRQCKIPIAALDDVVVNHAGEISHFKKEK